jgi:hypothetical protein
VDETARVEIQQQSQPAIQLILLLAEEMPESGVFDSLQRRLVETTLEPDGIHRQRAVLEHRSFLEPAALEAEPRIFGVDRRHLEQRIEAVGNARGASR